MLKSGNELASLSERCQFLFSKYIFALFLNENRRSAEYPAKELYAGGNNHKDECRVRIID